MIPERLILTNCADIHDLLVELRCPNVRGALVDYAMYGVAKFCFRGGFTITVRRVDFDRRVGVSPEVFVG